MEKPLCKICSPPRRHWSNEPHAIAGRKGNPAAKKRVPKRKAKRA